MSISDAWRRLPLSRRLWVGGSGLFVAVALSLLIRHEDSKAEVYAGERIVTSGEDNPVVAEGTDRSVSSTTGSVTSTTSTTSAPSSTTAPPTTTAPTSTTAAPVQTTPPAPPTTVVTGPPEFRATVRGNDQGPDYYAVFFGQTFGADGGFKVFANCRPGTVTVTVIDDGVVEPLPPQHSPLVLLVTVDDTFTPGNYLGDPGTTVWDFNPVSDGTVITSPVKTRVRIWAIGPSDHDVRIQYDCRG